MCGRKSVFLSRCCGSLDVPDWKCRKEKRAGNALWFLSSFIQVFMFFEVYVFVMGRKSDSYETHSNVISACDIREKSRLHVVRKDMKDKRYAMWSTGSLSLSALRQHRSYILILTKPCHLGEIVTGRSCRFFRILCVVYHYILLSRPLCNTTSLLSSILCGVREWRSQRHEREPVIGCMIAFLMCLSRREERVVV